MYANLKLSSVSISVIGSVLMTSSMFTWMWTLKPCPHLGHTVARFVHCVHLGDFIVNHGRPAVQDKIRTPTYGHRIYMLFSVCNAQARMFTILYIYVSSPAWFFSIQQCYIMCHAYNSIFTWIWTLGPCITNDYDSILFNQYTFHSVRFFNTYTPAAPKFASYF